MNDERKPATTIKVDWSRLSDEDTEFLCEDHLLTNTGREFLFENVKSVSDLILVKAPIPLMSYFMQNPDFMIQLMSVHQNATISFRRAPDPFSYKNISQMDITFEDDVDAATSLYSFYTSAMDRKIDDFQFINNEKIRDFENELFEYFGWIKRESSFPDVVNYTKILFKVRFRKISGNVVTLEVVEISLP